MSTGFGIDLGTTRTSVAFVTPNEPARGWIGTAEVVRLPDGETTPSAILFEPDREIYGTVAKNTGHRASDCAQIFKREMPNRKWTFRPSSRSKARVSAEELSGMLLGHVAEQASAMVGIDVEDVVIAVPAYFGEIERRSTKEAGKAAGLNVLDIINEPSAAILSYVFQPGVKTMDGSILVFDLGGGTFDTVVVEVAGDSIRVAAIDGDLRLGGRDFDEAIAVALSKAYVAEHPDADWPVSDIDARQRLLLDVEQARERLSLADRTSLTVYGSGEFSNKPLQVDLSRSEVEEMLGAQLERCLEIVDRALEVAASKGVEPTRVLFVGGASKSPFVQAAVLSEFPDLTTISVGSEPDLLVAKGAAIWAQKRLFERQFMRSLKLKDLGSVDWTNESVTSAVRALAKKTAYSRPVVERLLRCRMTTISSRGYAILCNRYKGGPEYLAYMMNAQDELPYSSPAPQRFIWLEDMSEWSLKLYEDLPGNPGTEDPREARVVETLTGPMNRTFVEGSKFVLEIDVDENQIVRLRGQHLEGDAPGGSLDVIVNNG